MAKTSNIAKLLPWGLQIVSIDGNYMDLYFVWTSPCKPSYKLLSIFLEILCSNTTFGDGPLGYIGRADCDKDKTGEITAECMANAKYENVQDRCVLKEIQNLLDLSVVSLILPLNNKKLQLHKLTL